ncbi:MAG: sigma-70 family RNA polymerase sigma factor [Candidatus Sulfopaludibacter sp.]|nr:sigma-70 family RNA polymerase sigma factor [Candidatus Sulfopaludibacter sp.]
MGPTGGDITKMLNRSGVGGGQGVEDVIAMLHSELRRIAARLMASERRDHTLQPTIIADEAYLQLVDQHNRNWRNRAHFFAAAAQTMRHILVDYGRRRRSQKRGGRFQRVDLDQAERIGIAPDDDVLALDEALKRLEHIDPRQSRIVELRYFGGLTEEETAEVMNTSPRTIKREWAFARAWLYAELTQPTPREEAGRHT